MNPSKHSGGMYVEETGTPGSPAIVFIHGVGQSSREWREHMAGLSGFHCLAPDLPGHGRSNHLPLPSNERIADLLAELIEIRVPAGRAHIVGISWGALLAQVLMERHPDRVERAVSDGLPLVWPRGARPLMLWFVTLSTPFLHTRPVLALYRDTHDPADLRMTSRQAFWKVWAGSLAHLSAATEAPCPTLLVAGEKEGFVRPANAALTALMPQAEAWFAPGLDHCWQRKAPDLHIRMVEAWCTGQELPPELRPEPAPSPAAVERVRAVVRRPDGLYVEESGTPGSPAIVFIHGGGQSGREWHEHMARLSAFHCLAPDLPGHGRSNHLPSASPSEIADLVGELIETRIPARRASVVGVSWGGALIHALLDRHPDLVERAVIDGSPPYLAPRGAGLLMALFMAALSPFIHTRPVMALFRETHDSADLRAASRRAFRRAIADSFQTTAATGAPCPVLLVAGEKESMIRPADAALASLMPHAEAWFAPGLDHCWQRTTPDLHIRMVEAWVSGQGLPAELRPEPAPSPAAVERLRAMGRRPGAMHVAGSLKRSVAWGGGTPGAMPGLIGSRVNAWMHRPVYEMMAGALDLQPDDDLLDVACGSGDFLAGHASRAYHVAGLDLSGGKVSLARRRLADRVAAGTAEIVVGDAAALPWADGRFSLVTSMDAFPFFPEPGRALAEMRRVLRPGGRAVLGFGWKVAAGTKPHAVLGHRMWDEAEVRRMTGAAGFAEVGIWYGPAGGDSRLLNVLARLMGASEARFVRAVKPA